MRSPPTIPSIPSIRPCSPIPLRPSIRSSCGPPRPLPPPPPGRSGNWGQYVNEEANELILKIPTTTDQNELKDIYTKLTEIYLTEVPSFSLMYRPSVFHAVNESVWTNFPSGDDGRGIPPLDCTDGYGIAALYDLELVG